VFSKYLLSVARIQALCERGSGIRVGAPDSLSYHINRFVAFLPVAHGVTIMAAIYTVFGQSPTIEAVALVVAGFSVATSAAISFGKALQVKAHNEIAHESTAALAARIRGAKRYIIASWLVFLLVVLVAGLSRG
jgi:purine-cytosine permease-like protein